MKTLFFCIFILSAPAQAGHRIAVNKTVRHCYEEDPMTSIHQQIAIECLSYAYSGHHKIIGEPKISSRIIGWGHEGCSLIVSSNIISLFECTGMTW